MMILLPLARIVPSASLVAAGGCFWRGAGFGRGVGLEAPTLRQAQGRLYTTDKKNFKKSLGGY
jgi:hypothetical protein